MAAETAREFDALEAQARELSAVFVATGYEAVSPAVIQPAGVFLDTIGEGLRARTYVFTDPEGEELCLRPDLTVPTCRLHLERHAGGQTPAKYCYNGLAFRFQPMGADTAHPREFHQAGIEAFGAIDRETAEAETLATVAEGLRATGLSDWRLRIGDLGLFRAVLTAADMPLRWRERLSSRFWRPSAFRRELARLASDPGARSGGPVRALMDIDPEAPEEAERIVAAHLEKAGIDMIGARSLAEVTEGLLAAAEDAKSEPLDLVTVRLIESYIAVEAPARSAGARVAALAREQGLDISDAIGAFERRLRLLGESGVDTASARFSAEFGRGLAYYTGFVFEVVTSSLGPESPIAGGGRYDTLMRLVGAPEDVPAVGAAVHTERLLTATSGRREGARS